MSGSRKLAAYDADNPRTRIEGFLLNFDTYRVDEGTGEVILSEGAPVKSRDGTDRIFGDLGNDWLVGGTGADRMFGGRGDDYLNADDNMETAGGLNDQPDAPLFADADFAYGGAGLDVLMANTGADRLFDWTGEFNSFIVPFSPFGAPTVNRLLAPHVKAFLEDLGIAEGADSTLAEPNGELGLVDQDDPDWNEQHGAPRDPQPGNIGGVQRDTQGGKEDMANPPDCGCDCDVIQVSGVQIEKFVNGLDADAGPGPSLQIGDAVTWTYLVSNRTDNPLTILSVADDAGTAADTGDDFVPAAVTLQVGGVDYNVGDIDHDNLLDSNENWVYSATGTVAAGAYVNVAVVTAEDTTDVPTTYTDEDSAHYFGGVVEVPLIRIEKAINAVDPENPTVQEDADSVALGPLLTIGSDVIWTYQLFNESEAALLVTGIVDVNAADANDSFTPLYVSGDTDGDGLLDTDEAWLYTSEGRVDYQVTEGVYSNLATVTAEDVSGTLTASDSDSNYHTGTPALVTISGRMTGGGSVFTDDGMRVTHGFELHSDPNIGPNSLEVNFNGNRFHLEQLTSVIGYDDPDIDQLPRSAPFDTMSGEGIGRLNNQDGYSVRFLFTDAGEPGSKDFAEIEIIDPDGNLVLYVADQLTRGDQQAHPENKSVSLLLAAEGPSGVSSTDTLSEADLDAIVGQARHRWEATGLVDARELGTIDVRIADLSGLSLGAADASSDTITLDGNAAGWGWFVDATPQEESEFTLIEEDSLLLADAASDAHGRIDLLTVVIHEMGHLLGLGHENGVMAASLVTGERLLPEEHGADGTDATSSESLITLNPATEPADRVEQTTVEPKRVERVGTDEPESVIRSSVAALFHGDPAMAVGYLSARSEVGTAALNRAYEHRERLFDDLAGTFDLMVPGSAEETPWSGEEPVDDWIFDHSAAQASADLGGDNRVRIDW